MTVWTSMFQGVSVYVHAEVQMEFVEKALNPSKML